VDYYLELTLPWAALEGIAARPRGQRLVAVRHAHVTGQSLPRLPLRFNRWGALELDGDGNHRLLAARELGMGLAVSVRCRCPIQGKKQINKVMRRFRGWDESSVQVRR
jgi:hypothetical protein